MGDGSNMNTEVFKALFGNRVRPQEVHTPRDVLDIVRSTFGGSIALDPCAPSDERAWFAKANITLPADSLPLDWTLIASGGGIYVNPPFKTLKPWVYKCAREGERGARIVLLFPFRSSRRWAWRGTVAAEVVMLSSWITFVGYDHPYPAPLALASWNCTIPPLGKREVYRLAPRKDSAPLFDWLAGAGAP